MLCLFSTSLVFSDDEISDPKILSCMNIYDASVQQLFFFNQFTDADADYVFLSFSYLFGPKIASFSQTRSLYFVVSPFFNFYMPDVDLGYLEAGGSIGLTYFGDRLFLGLDLPVYSFYGSEEATTKTIIDNFRIKGMVGACTRYIKNDKTKRMYSGLTFEYESLNDYYYIRNIGLVIGTSIF